MIYECPGCPRKFKNQTKLKAHLIKNGGEYWLDNIKSFEVSNE